MNVLKLCIVLEIIYFKICCMYLINELVSKMIDNMSKKTLKIIFIYLFNNYNNYNILQQNFNSLSITIN
jgi:hypothetical protein